MNNMDCFDVKSSKNQAAQRPCERGSAIVLILVAIALFGLLSFTMAKGTRTGAQNISKEKASLLATETLEYGRAMKNAIHDLLINGCAETEISFETGGSYINPGAPADKSCHVFEPEGGGLRLKPIPEDIQTLNTLYRNPFFVGKTAVLNVGTTAGELYLWMRTRSKDVCMKYNTLAGVSNLTSDAPAEAGFDSAPLFVGTYSAGATLGDDNDGANFSGKMTGCHKDAAETDTDGSPYYDFYYVLIAR